jgi:hypothetical protein
MTKRNPLPLWIVVTIFLAAVTAVPLTCGLRSRSATSPPTVTELRTLTELGEVLSQAAPELRVVQMAKYGSLERGFYLCTDARSWGRLASVLRNEREADKWQGVVYCERQGGNISSIPEREIQLWGELAMQIEPFLFFGDPHLLRRIDQIIRNHAKREQR